MASIKPSQRIKEICVELATKDIDIAMGDPRINAIREMIGAPESLFKNNRAKGIEEVSKSCEVFRRAVLQYLDEQAEHVEKLLSINKCQ